jgi:hypothetical protein
MFEAPDWIQAHGDEEMKTLLNAWIKAVHRYMSIANSHDNSWWYNERANISTLAGAAWTLDGWTALEEYNTRKRLAKNDTSKPKTDGLDSPKTDRAGRADLYLANSETAFVIEAKHAWQRFGPDANASTYVYEGMHAAWLDVQATFSEPKTRRFAATFVVPSIAKSHVQLRGKGPIDRGELRKYLEEWLTTLGDFRRPRGKPPYFAYTFPLLGNERFNWGSRHYPGVVLILEEFPKRQGT